MILQYIFFLVFMILQCSFLSIKNSLLATPWERLLVLLQGLDLGCIVLEKTNLNI